MKKWQKLEDAINQKLEKTISNVGNTVSQTTPDKVRAWKKGVENKIANTKDQILSSPRSLTEKIIGLRQSAVDRAHDLKVNLHKNLEDSKSGPYGRFGIAASILAFLEWALMPLYKNLAKWLASMQPSTLASSVVLLTVGTITSIGVYTNSNKIVEEAGLVEREPAAIERSVEARPKYYKRNEKELLIANVVIPSYSEGKTSLKKLQIDFTIISSNRYIREYFYDNTFLVEDVFNTKIEPVIPGFPLSDEGKLIIKEKIKDELNALLKRMNIKGSIDQVYISSILAA